MIAIARRYLIPRQLTEAGLTNKVAPVNGFLDPMAGAGTILVERAAALFLALATASRSMNGCLIGAVALLSLYGLRSDDGGMASLFEPFGFIAVETLQAGDAGADDEVQQQPVLHADETPVAMLDPGAGKTKRAYLFAYRSAADPPEVVFGRDAPIRAVRGEPDRPPALGQGREGGLLLPSVEQAVRVGQQRIRAGALRGGDFVVGLRR